MISGVSKYMPLFTETEGNKKNICLKKGKRKEQSHRKPGLAVQREELRGQMPVSRCAAVVCLKEYSEPVFSAIVTSAGGHSCENE